MSTSFSIPFQETGQAEVLLKEPISFYAFYAESATSVHCDHPEYFKPELKDFSLAVGATSSKFKANVSDGLCCITTRYMDGERPLAVSRPVHISKNGTRFPFLIGIIAALSLLGVIAWTLTDD